MNRRQLLWGGLIASFGAAGIGLLTIGPRFSSWLTRVLRPKPLFEPSNIADVGRPSDFGVGMHTQYLKTHRICVVRNSERLYAIYARCTHMGCTPDWSSSEQKFRCPCHGSDFCMGSAFDGDGMNCEGPAPRPLDRVHVELNAEGRVMVNIGKLYQWPKGDRSEFDDPGAYIQLRQG